MTGTEDFIKENYEPVEDKPGYVWFSKRNFQIISIETLAKCLEDAWTRDLYRLPLVWQESQEKMLDKEESEQVEYLKNLLFNQLGITQEILNDAVDDCHNRTIELILSDIQSKEGEHDQ